MNDLDDKRWSRAGYPLAVFMGIFCAGLSLTWMEFLEAQFGVGARDIKIVGFAAVAAIFAALGGVFGLVLPEKSWRWGVWLCALPACFLSITSEPESHLFLGFLALAFVPACAGAYAAARLHLKYTGEI